VLRNLQEGFEVFQRLVGERPLLLDLYDGLGVLVELRLQFLELDVRILLDDLHECLEVVLGELGGIGDGTSEELLVVVLELFELILLLLVSFYDCLLEFGLHRLKFDLLLSVLGVVHLKLLFRA